MSINTDLSIYIKQKALDEGALLVGYTKIRRVEPVIVFGFPFTEKWFFNQPLKISNMIRKNYVLSTHVQNTISNILMKEGYTSHQKTILSLYGDFRPLAVSANLGDWGRNGIVANEKYGSGLLFSAIFTNAPLALDIPKEDVSQNHCINCEQCIKSCPANAFENNTFHTSRCLPYVIRGCSECIKACSR